MVTYDGQSSDTSGCVRIYFSDFFEIDPDVLDSYGAFNVSLVNDLPLFVDPFLLFDSNDGKYKLLHDNIIRYVKFLRDRCLIASANNPLVDQWFLFPEVRQNWLGFSKNGNRGSGLGKDFAHAIQLNLTKMFVDFGNENLTRGSHLEKLCLVEGGVGRDHLSDFTTNLIKEYLLSYTQEFAIQNINEKFIRSFAVNKIHFNYESMRWTGGRYQLPCYGNDFVLLTPKDILTKDESWINRSELVDNVQDIYNAIPDFALRDSINTFFVSRLSEGMKAKDRKQLSVYTLQKFPELLDYYIKRKEDRGAEAHKVSNYKVAETEKQFVEQLNDLVRNQLEGTEFYELGDSYEEAMRRVHFLKEVIENNDGYRVFYLKGKPISRESDLQILYRLTWYASRFDVNREVNNGRGPVDFKVSDGSKDKTLIEFKLASNSKLKMNLAHQVEVYEKANLTKKSIKVILYFSDSEFIKVTKILKELNLNHSENIVLIDACADNKISGSNVA